MCTPFSACCVLVCVVLSCCVVLCCIVLCCVVVQRGEETSLNPLGMVEVREGRHVLGRKGNGREFKRQEEN